MVYLAPGQFYHIYNRSNSGSLLFYSERNYCYFLNKLSKYILTVSDIFSYCLLPNHFHLLIRIKDDQAPENCSKAFSNFFNCYSKSINKEQRRHGSLFEKPFKRKPVINEDYLRILINYIHRNPIHHNMCDEISKYKWSSYNSILSNDNEIIDTNGILNLFGDIETFVTYVKRSIDDYKDLILE